MEHIYQQIQTDFDNILWEWEESGYLHSGDVFVVGCSTSEIIGKDIGSAGSEEVASILFEAFNAFRKKTGVHLVFQCCEHLNRALVIERTALDSLKTPLRSEERRVGEECRCGRSAGHIEQMIGRESL